MYGTHYFHSILVCCSDFQDPSVKLVSEFTLMFKKKEHLDTWTTIGPLSDYSRSRLVTGLLPWQQYDVKVILKSGERESESLLQPVLAVGNSECFSVVALLQVPAPYSWNLALVGLEKIIHSVGYFNKNPWIMSINSFVTFLHDEKIVWT